MTISDYLERDHRRIAELLQRATTSSDRIDPVLSDEFRGALLRHIGMEEKILFPSIRMLAAVEQLHLDHGALAALLVPTPTAPIINVVRTILARHNVLEEGSEGIYRQFEQRPDIDPDKI